MILTEGALCDRPLHYQKHSGSRDYRHGAVDPGLALAQPVRQPARAVFQPNGGAPDDLRGILLMLPAAVALMWRVAKVIAPQLTQTKTPPSSLPDREKRDDADH